MRVMGRTVYEFLVVGSPLQLSMSWKPYDLTVGTLAVLPGEDHTPGRAS